MKYLFFCFCLICLISCSSTKELTEAERSQLNKIETLLDTKSIAFEGDWAYPLASSSLNQLANYGLLGNGNNAGSINLQGNPNYIRIINDSISAYLPYYGERRVGGGYNTDSGIVIDGLLENYEHIVNNEKGTVLVTFKASQKTEKYDVSMTIFHSGKTDIVINSTQRANIRYAGSISEWDANGEE